MQKRWVSVVIWVVVLAMPVALVVGGVVMLARRGSGTPARATVAHCETTHVYKSYSEHCTGSWTVDGRPAVGTVQGADHGDVGHTIEVRIRGGEAHSTSLELPVLLVAIGVAFAALIAWPRLRGRVRRPPASA